MKKHLTVLITSLIFTTTIQAQPDNVYDKLKQLDIELFIPTPPTM